MQSPTFLRLFSVALLLIISLDKGNAQVPVFCDDSPITEVVGARTLIYPCDTPLVELSYESVDVDSNFVAVGYPEIDQVYVYEKVGGIWKTNSILQGLDTDAGDLFGHYTHIKDDFLLVGAIKADGVQSQSGAAYLFQYNGVEWVERSKIFATDGESGGEYGDELVLDDTLIFVASPKAPGKLGQPEGGAVYMYRYDGTSGTAPVEKRKIQFTNSYRFGFGLAYNNGWLAISRQLASIPGGGGGVGRSRVNLYKLSGFLKPTLHQYIQIPNTRPESRRFGATIRMKNNWLLVGSSAEREGIMVYKFDGIDWHQEVSSSIPGGPQLYAGLNFDFDGETIIQYYRKFNVWHNTGSGSWRKYRFSTGTIRSYKFDGSSWKLEKQVAHLDSISSGNAQSIRLTFGKALAIDGDQVVATEGGGYSFWWGSETYPARAQIFPISQAENVPDSIVTFPRLETAVLKPEFFIAPNPALSQLSVSGPAVCDSKPILYTLMGQKLNVPMLKKQACTWEVDVRTLLPGAYLVGTAQDAAQTAGHGQLFIKR